MEANKQIKRIKLNNLDDSVSINPSSRIKLLKEIEKYYPNKGNLLDAGSGNGKLAMFFALNGYTVTGIEKESHDYEISKTLKINKSASADLQVVKSRSDFINKHAPHVYNCNFENKSIDTLIDLTNYDIVTCFITDKSVKKYILDLAIRDKIKVVCLISNGMNLKEYNYTNIVCKFGKVSRNIACIKL